MKSLENKYTLIMPLSHTNCTGLPLEFQLDKNGIMNCIKSLLNISLFRKIFSDIYFTINEHQNNKWHLAEQINLQLKNIDNLPKINFCLLDHETDSQAETVYETIKINNICGPIFIKDGDNTCVINGEFEINNYVLTYPLENCKLVDPQHKSYITIDDNMYVTNVIEKRVVSNMFNCGGYAFKNADDYINTYDLIYNNKNINNPHLYISHIIYYMLLNNKEIFRPLEASNYIDFAI